MRFAPTVLSFIFSNLILVQASRLDVNLAQARRLRQILPDHFQLPNSYEDQLLAYR